MNSIFLKFAYQSNLFKDIPHPYEELEKFAELLIRDCLYTIKTDMELAHLQSISIDFEMYSKGRLIRI